MHACPACESIAPGTWRATLVLQTFQYLQSSGFGELGNCESKRRKMYEGRDLGMRHDPSQLAVQG